MSSSLSKMFSSIKIDFTSPTTVLLIVAVAALMWCLYKYSNDLNQIVSSMEDGSGKSEEMPDTKEQQVESSVLPAPKALSGSDLMPKDENKDHPALTTLSANVPDVLAAGQHLGATSQSLRNANLQVRSDPQIPAVDTGPWNKSTIEPDMGRVPLELGIIGN